MEDIHNSLFVTGRGAGKINVWNLKQFEPNRFDRLDTSDVDVYYDQVNQIITDQIELLTAIFEKDTGDYNIEQADNKDAIIRVIIETPLAEREYRFLENRLRFQRYNLINRYFSLMFQRNDSSVIDFSHPFFELDESDLTRVNTLNHWSFANGLEGIQSLEYLREKQNEEGEICYNNYRSQFDSTFQEWRPFFITHQFNKEVNRQYFADLYVWFATMGKEYILPPSHQYILKEDTKYARRIHEFQNLLDNGLNDPAYNLNAEELTLDKAKFDALLAGNKGKFVYFNFWSAQFAGSTIIGHLPAFKAFEETYKDQLKVINICIDKLEHKNLWAARIIDSDWRATHYFMPEEWNPNTLVKFSDKDIADFCGGGATYSLVDRAGDIENDLKSPLNLSKTKLSDLLNKSPSH